MRADRSEAPAPELDEEIDPFRVPWSVARHPSTTLACLIVIFSAMAALVALSFVASTAIALGTFAGVLFLGFAVACSTARVVERRGARGTSRPSGRGRAHPGLHNAHHGIR